MLGFIILAGIVVNNAILLVQQAIRHVRDGLDTKDAVLESVRVRLRPIFMSTTTSVLGMLPLTLGQGAGSELYKGLGAVIIGGLLMSTLFTLVLTPVLFASFRDMREWVSARVPRLTDRVPSPERPE